MKTRMFALVFALALFPGWRPAMAQPVAKSLDTVEEIAPDGSTTITFQVAFDAEAWGNWKAQVGDDPARLRGLMRHQFSAFVIEEFKFEKDDLNRTARMSMRSPAGPELRRDQRLQIPMEPWCRLINNSGRTWFFSGNNPFAGNGLTTIKVVLPENLVEASLVNTGTPEQALVYELAVPAGRSRALVWGGVVVLLAGAALMMIGLRSQGVPAAPPAAVPPATAT